MMTTTMTDTDARILARIASGGAASTTDLEQLSTEARDMAGRMLDAADGERLTALDGQLAGRSDADAVRWAIFGADPLEEGVSTLRTNGAGVEPEPDYPALPDHLRPQVGTANAGAWLDTYIASASARSPMTPRIFHESAGLWLASVAVARRLRVRMPYGEVYPNLWMLWLAPTTIFHKSTGMAIAEGLAHDLFPHLLLPGQTTPEALFGELAGREPFFANEMSDADRVLWERERDFAAQRSLLIDEASGMLNEAGRDYNAGLQEQLLKLYDCATVLKRQTQKQGRLTIHNAYLSLLIASTPSAMRTHLRPGNLWTGGWWARCVILTPEVAWQDYQVAPDDIHEPRELKRNLALLYRRLPQPRYPDTVNPVTVTLADGVAAAYLSYHKTVGHDMLRDLDERLYGPYGRLPAHMLKVAMLLAALDWPEDRPAPCIELTHLARAIDIVEGWRASLHRAVRQSSHTENEDLRERLLDQLDVAGEAGATCRDVARALNLKAPAVEKQLRTLVTEGQVETVPQDSGPKGGRPTVRYRRRV